MRAFRPLRRALLSARGSLFCLFSDPTPPNEGGRREKRVIQVSTNGAAMPTDEDDHDSNFLLNHPERGGNFAAAWARTAAVITAKIQPPPLRGGHESSGVNEGGADWLRDERYQKKRGSDWPLFPFRRNENALRSSL